MGLIWANIRKDRAPGATATTVTDDIKKSYTIQALIIEQPMRMNGTTTSTVLGMTQLIDQMRVETIFGQPQSTIDGEDLFDTNILALREFPYVNTSSTDNDPIGTSDIYPFSPFPLDYDRNYGLPPNVGTQLVLDWVADPSNIDGRTYSIMAVGNPDVTSPLGWVSFIRDARSAGAAGDELTTQIIGKRLLGIRNFGTTSYTDLAAADAFNITTFRDHAITESDDVILGPVQEFGLWVPGAYEIGAIIDEGSTFWDLGFQTTGDPVGIDIAGKNFKYKSTRGATDAGRQHPVRLL